MNEMADALSRLGIKSSNINTNNETYHIRNIFKNAIDVPIKASVIYKHQSEDKSLSANEHIVKQNIDSYYL